VDNQAGDTTGDKREGNDEAARQDQDEQHAIVKDKAKIEQRAREAAALDGPQGEVPETAQMQSTKGAEQRSK